jgi:hypothetical protein
MRLREEDLLAVREGVDERISPLVERHGKGGRGGIGEAVLSRGEERRLPHGPHQANRLRDGERLADPLQRVMRRARHVGLADEAFEQPQARGKQLLFLLAQRGGFFDRNANARDAGVRRRTVTPIRGPSRGADGDQCGRRS